MGIVHHPNIVTDGLAACWDGANRKSYPETGAWWTDIAGNNIGTFVNEAAFDSDNMGTISLDGTDDYVTVPNNDVFDYYRNFELDDNENHLEDKLWNENKDFKERIGYLLDEMRDLLREE